MKKAVVWVVMILILSAIYLHTENEITPQKKISELEIQLEKSTGEKKVDMLNRLSTLFLYKDHTRAMEYAGQAVELAERIDYPQGKATAFIHLARGHWASGDYKKSLKCCEDALTIFKISNDSRATLTAFGTTANFYRINGNYDKALEYNIEALKISERLNDKENMAEFLFQVGNTYMRMSEPGKALTYFQKALKTGKETAQNRRMVYSINNIGLAYMGLEQYTRALEHFQKALSLFTEKGNKAGISNTLLNIGIIYARLENYDESFNYLRKALEKFRETGGREGMCRTLFNIGDNYLKMKHYKKAIVFYDDALIMAREINDMLVIEYIYENYAEAYAAAGDYGNAFKYHKRFTEIKDNRLDEKKNKQIAELQEQYEAQTRAREIEILKQTNKIQQITRNVLIGGVILLVVFLGFMFKKYMYLFAFWKKQKHIGQYRLLVPIGSGGMGNVFKAHNIRDKTSVVAIKVLRDELLKTESSRTRFKHEAAIIDKLDHPNILKILERGIHDDKLYFVMEYIDGITLEKRIETAGQMELREARHIMIQVADALALIHHRDIVHRDLKPSNIMLTQKDGAPDVVKLLDFGLSRMKYQTRVTESGFLLGTVNYLAPEQILDFKYSTASDIYALGVVFYEMMTGKFAFTGDSLSAIVEQVLYHTLPPPAEIRPGVPGELNQLILGMTKKQDNMRPTAQTVLETLKRLPF